VLFAITDDDVRAIDERDGTEELADYVSEVVEERWEEGFVCELDKAWDPLHRALNDGTLDPNAGEFPLNAAVFGREELDAGEDFYVGLTRAADVPAVAAAVAGVSADALRAGYARINPAGYAGEHGEEDFEYLLEWFEDFGPFWQRAAAAGRAVIFTVDQ
jgi:hypothetical protein